MSTLYVALLNMYILFSMTNCKHYSFRELKSLFEVDPCIEGNINTIYLTKKETKAVKNMKVESILNLTSVGNIHESEKPVLSLLNELVGYNQIDYYFKLQNEEGPSHNKVFTVALTLGKETYIGHGKSLKKAKQDVATKALEQTEYESPPTQNKTLKDIEELTPTVLLNNIAAKLGVVVTYYLLDKDKQEILHSNIVMTEKSKSYMQKLNDSIYTDKKLRMKKDIDAKKGPFRLKLEFGKHVFFATSHAIQSGRHEVASMALDFLAKNKDNLDIACLKDGSEAECKKNKEELKSPVSKVYEEAQKRQLYVEFEVIKESGPSHKKSFHTECRLGDVVTVGEGFSKKESKKAAAISMLDKLSEMDPLPPEVEMKNFGKSNQKMKKKKKNKIIKTTFDEIAMVLDKMSESMTGMAKTIFGEDDKPEDSTKDSKNRKQKLRDDQPKESKKKSQNQLLELSNVLNFKIGYTDFTEKNDHISLLSLYTNPEYTCFGESKTESDARNVAASYGIKLLDKNGIFDMLLEQKETSLERETKEEIRIVINQIISKKEEL